MEFLLTEFLLMETDLYHQSCAQWRPVVRLLSLLLGLPNECQVPYLSGYALGMDEPNGVE